MNLSLSLTPQAEARLRKQAETAGQDVETFVLQAIREKLRETDSESASPRRDHPCWADALKGCLDLHPDSSHLADDSRESIYTGCGE